MDVLVLGGSVFLGRAVVAEALARGDRVTVFHRGVSAAAPDGAVHIRGDRTVAADLQQLRGRRFDLVVDTCGYVPADVDASARLLSNSVGHYAFVSSISVYPGWPEEPDYRSRGVWDGDPDAGADDEPAGAEPGAQYGWRKVGCERAVLRAFGADRATVLRAGCIVGPHDSAVGRLPWWIDRVARAGEVLAPGRPDDPVALIDARDLARFALLGRDGVFDAGGPAARDTRADLLAACRAATGSDAAFTWVADDWLAAQDVEAWTEVPLWVPASAGPSTFASHSTAAAAAGLRWRPLAETVADTWAWQRAVTGGWQPTGRTPGLAPEREHELLERWHATPG